MANEEGRDRTAAARAKRTRTKHDRWVREMLAAGYHIVAPEVVGAAVAQLGGIGAGDPEGAHDEMDRVALTLAPQAVQDAHQKVIKRLPWHASA